MNRALKKTDAVPHNQPETVAPVPEALADNRSENRVPVPDAAPAPAAIPASAPVPGPVTLGGDPAEDSAPRRSRWRRRMLIASVPLILAAVGGYIWLTGGRYATTDNAYVHQPLVPVSAEVAGRIVSVDVTENQEIAAGTPLFSIDPTPYRIALEQADATLAAARLSVAQLRAARMTAQAKLSAAQAILEVRERELTLQRSLADQKITAGTAVDEATLALQSATNEVALSRQALNATAAALGGDPSVATDDVPAVRAAVANLAAARLTVGQLRSDYATAEAKLDATTAILKVRSREQKRHASLADLGINSAAALDQTNLSVQAATNEVKLAEQGVAAAAAALGGDPKIATDATPAVMTAVAGIATARLSVDRLRAAHATARARLDAALSIVAVQKGRLARQRSLADQNVAATSAVDAATLADRSAENDVALARQGLNVALAALGGKANIATDDTPVVRTALAQHKAAVRALDLTQVTAPAAGVVTQIDSLNVGQYVTPGTMVASLAETSRTWIEANFKETQIAGMTVGQPVDVEIDAYPGLTLHGTVESIGSTTGSQLSLIPAQNATGNWVKVVQRLPIRIAVTPDPAHPLRGGMSAHVSVDGGHSRLDGLL